MWECAILLRYALYFPVFVSLLRSKKAASAREKGVADTVIKCFLQGDWHLIAL